MAAAVVEAAVAALLSVDAGRYGWNPDPMVDACEVVADVLGVEADEVRVRAKEEVGAEAAAVGPGVSLGSSKPRGPQDGLRASPTLERSKPCKIRGENYELIR